MPQPAPPTSPTISTTSNSLRPAANTRPTDFMTGPRRECRLIEQEEPRRRPGFLEAGGEACNPTRFVTRAQGRQPRQYRPRPPSSKCLLVEADWPVRFARLSPEFNLWRKSRRPGHYPAEETA